MTRLAPLTIAITALTLAACGGTTTHTVTQTETVTQPQSLAKAQRRHRHKSAPTPTPKPRHRSSGSAGSFTMPNEVGQNLQAAQDGIQHASHDPIFVSHSRDATGENRFQILDRDWKVCSQNVAAGAQASAVEHIVFSVVKDYEDCP